MNMSSPRKRYLAAPRARPRARNPIEQLRAPWEGDSHHPLTTEVPWRAVQDIVRGERDSPMAIEVTTSGEHAEVIVYAIHAKRFGIQKPEEEGDAEASELKKAFDYAKGHATVILRGDVSNDTHSNNFCVRHRPPRFPPGSPYADQCGGDCTYADGPHDAHPGDGWRWLLWSFLNQHDFWERMSHDVPVVIDGAEPVTLNEAAIVSDEQRELFREVRAQALGMRDYYENNGNCVDEVPAAFLGDIVGGLLENRYLDIINESGETVHREMPNGPGIAVAAESKWRELIERLAHLEEWEGPFVETKWNQGSAPAKIRDDFEDWLRREVRHSTTMFNREEWNALEEEPPTPDPRGGEKRGAAKLNDKWLRVCTWSQDDVEDQLPEELLEDHDGDNTEAVTALGRIDIDWDGASMEYRVTCDCYWVFAIDVNDAIEKLDELIAEWKADGE